MWDSHLKGVLAAFILLMVFRDVSEEARLRAERTEMRCAIEAAQTPGSPK